MEKTFVILESHGHPRTFLYDKSFSNFLSSNDHIKELTQLSYEIEDIERKTLENLEILKDTMTVFKNNLNILDDEVKTSRMSSIREDKAEMVYIENAKILRENQDLKLQVQDLRAEWNEKLDKARVQWSVGLDNMKTSYERNIAEITENHEIEIKTLKTINSEKLSLSKENEKKLLEKLEIMNSEQKNVLNKLNEKINFLSQLHNEDNTFIEKVMKKVDEIFDKFDLIDKEYCFNNMKEKINSKLDDLEVVLEKNRQNIVKCTKSDVKKHVDCLKERLMKSNEVRKDFEDARLKLIKYFEDSPKGMKSKAFTDRY